MDGNRDDRDNHLGAGEQASGRVDLEWQVNEVFTLRARFFPDDEYPWWWFLGVPAEDRWLSYGMTTVATTNKIHEIVETIKSHRMVRLIMFIGEPWESVYNAGQATAETQRSILWNMTQETYEGLMEMSVSEVLDQRGHEEARAISEELGGSGQINMN